MRIVNKNNIVDEAVSLIKARAQYQKVVFCIDETSDMYTIEKIISKLNKCTVVLKYYYNKNNIDTFFNMINSGARVVVYNIAIEHFYKLQNSNNFILNIFLPQTGFVLPYMNNVESVYGDNVLMCDLKQKDNLSILFLYELALNNVWEMLLQGRDVETKIFKQIDMLTKEEDLFYDRLFALFNILKRGLNDNYKKVELEQLPYYFYLRICAILKMFESLDKGEEQYIDFYQSELSSLEISKAYNLISKYNIVDTIKFNGENLIKLTTVILNRFKILIKKYFNFKNIKLNKLIKLIKMQSKALNIDNLLYISYIFNTI